MRNLPNWAYNGGAVAGDVANGGKWLVSAGTDRGDFGKMHYRAGLNQIALAEWYRRHPDDLDALEIAVGATSGQMSNIDSTGAPAIYFHAYPHIMEHDAYSGDYGLGFFGSSLEASATLVTHTELGPLCYLCDVHASNASVGRSPPDVAGHVKHVTELTLVPRDAYRQRVYLEPLGLYVTADAGTFASLTLNLNERRLAITFAAPNDSPARQQTYDVLRLRLDKVARPAANRPGTNFRVVTPSGIAKRRAAFEIPAADPQSKQVVEVAWELR